MSIITGEVTGQQSLFRLEGDLAAAEASAALNSEVLALLAKQIMEQKLQQLLGDKTKHFGVHIIPSLNGVLINVHPIDEVGDYLYYGTAEHDEFGISMPIGNDGFANAVHHPGTKAWKSEVDALSLEVMAMIGAMTL